MPDEPLPTDDPKKLITEGRMSIQNFDGAEMKLHAELTKSLESKPELVVGEEPPAQAKDIVVVASNPQQMQAAQNSLIKHFETKLAGLRQELNEADENLKIARTRKWKMGPFETQVTKVQHNVEFYEKIKAALEAGYVIIPNFEDLDIFAIRTTRKKPKANQARGGSTWVEPPQRQITNRPVLGQGRYVNADTVNKTYPVDITKPGAPQKEFRMMSEAIGFDAIDFPFHLAKPQILESTAKAMKVLAFDDIGVSPNRRIRRGDPMIIGRIMKGSGHSKKVVSFLITWFVDTKDI